MNLKQIQPDSKLFPLLIFLSFIDFLKKLSKYDNDILQPCLFPQLKQIIGSICLTFFIDILRF